MKRAKRRHHPGIIIAGEHFYYCRLDAMTRPWKIGNGWTGQFEVSDAVRREMNARSANAPSRAEG